MPAISRDGSSPANYYNDGIGDGWGQRAFCVQNEMYADHPMKWPKRHRSLLELWVGVTRDNVFVQDEDVLINTLCRPTDQMNKYLTSSSVLKHFCTGLASVDVE